MICRTLYYILNIPDGLVILVEGPSKTDIHVEENNDRTCTVSYTPSLPGDYQICIKYADHDIAGSPFTARILPSSGADLTTVLLYASSLLNGLIF